MSLGLEFLDELQFFTAGGADGVGIVLIGEAFAERDENDTYQLSAVA